MVHRIFKYIDSSTYSSQYGQDSYLVTDASSDVTELFDNVPQDGKKCCFFKQLYLINAYIIING